VVSNDRSSTAVRDLRVLFDVGVTGTLTDGQLLDRFVARREEAVFEVILHRHGPMVWGVCRRVLRDHHDAEDAFQATFLVLARKASSVLPREKLGDWLYGVAYQTAVRARVTRTRRRMREGQVVDMPEPEAVSQDHRDDLTEWLDLELSRLPEKYRIPMVLCEWEGKTHREAADQLGWPIGTVSGRLSRAKAMLARRLSRRGMALSVGWLAVLLAQESASASMPTHLIASTAQAARLIAAGGAAAGMVPAGVAALTREVMKLMLLSKMKVATAMLVVGIALVAGGTGLAYRAQAQVPKQEKALESNQEKAIEGSWVTESIVRDGKTLDESKGVTFEFGKDTLTIIHEGGRLEPGTHKYKLGTSEMPMTIDLKTTRPDDKEMASKGIYSLKGDTLIICLAEPGADRPTELRATAGSGTTLTVLRRSGRRNETVPAPSPATIVRPLVGDEKLIQGAWDVIAMEKDGVDVTKELRRVEFRENGYMFMRWLKDQGPTPSDNPPITFFHLDQLARPKAIAIDRNLPQPKRGIYTLVGDILIVCLDEGIGQDRPTTFSARKGSGRTLIVLKKVM
jgi:RNA polymerase sigma-70 factor (ECF subfamily)